VKQLSVVICQKRQNRLWIDTDENVSQNGMKTTANGAEITDKKKASRHSQVFSIVCGAADAAP